jgi:hypothetical protein
MTFPIEVITNIALFVCVLTYSIIVSQSFMYALALRDTQLNLDALAYMQVRKLIDRNMQAKFRYATYAALLTTLLLIPMAFANGEVVLIVSSLVAFSMLVLDTIITVRGNLPINATINGWTNESYPANWQEARSKWLQYYQYRQILNITGFVALVAGAVFR